MAAAFSTKRADKAIARQHELTELRHVKDHAESFTGLGSQEQECVTHPSNTPPPVTCAENSLAHQTALCATHTVQAPSLFRRDGPRTSC